MTLVMPSRNRQAMVSVKHDGIRSTLYRTICRDRKNALEYRLWAGRAVDGTIPVHLLTVVIIRRPECTFGTTFFWVWTYGTVFWKRARPLVVVCILFDLVRRNEYCSLFFHYFWATYTLGFLKTWFCSIYSENLNIVIQKDICICVIFIFYYFVIFLEL